MLFISTGIFDDKVRPQILSVGTTANSPLRDFLVIEQKPKLEVFDNSQGITPEWKK
jgi:hypothetical protein